MTPTSREPRWLAVALAVAMAVAAALSGSALGWPAALTSAAIAWAAFRAHGGQPLLAGQCVPYATGVALLGVCGVGLDPSKQNLSSVGRPIRLADPDAKPLEELL